MLATIAEGDETNNGRIGVHFWNSVAVCALYLLHNITFATFEIKGNYKLTQSFIALGNSKTVGQVLTYMLHLADRS